MKPYNNFSDIYGNEYNFNDYNEFEKFWFSQKVKTLKLYFGNDFKKLQNSASNSQEARKKSKN